MNKDKDMDIKLIKFMVNNQQKSQLSPGTMKFLLNYLIECVENDWKDKNNDEEDV